MEHRFSDLVISFDIGIQNLAFCIFQPNPILNELPTIIDWQCINILHLDASDNNSSDIIVPLCNHPQKNGKPCSSAAHFIHVHPITKESKVYCKKHACLMARQCHYVYDSTHGSAKIERSTKIKMRQMCEQDTYIHAEPFPPKDASKSEWTQYTINRFKSRLLCSLAAPKKPPMDSSSQMMVQIGKNIKEFFDARETTPYIGTVLIENQIAPHIVSTARQRMMGTTRMKMIQGILMEYFIVRGHSSIHIEFVSSAHKLNQFLDSSPQSKCWAPYFPNGTLLTSTHGLNSGAVYRAHKKQAGVISAYLLNYPFPSDKNPGWKTWEPKRNASHKKDDLDDAFLQGLVFFMTPSKP